MGGGGIQSIETQPEMTEMMERQGLETIIINMPKDLKENMNIMKENENTEKNQINV